MEAKPQKLLATEGGPKAVAKLGPFPSKLGREELWELIDLWEFSPGNKQRIKEILEHDANVEGPHLFRYYNPKPSRVAAAEEAMRELIGVEVLPRRQLLHLGADCELSGFGNRGR